MFNVRRTIESPFPSKQEWDQTIEVGASCETLLQHWGHMSVNDLKQVCAKVQEIYKDKDQMYEYLKSKINIDCLLLAKHANDSNIEKCVRFCVFAAIDEHQKILDCHKKIVDFWKSLDRLEYDGISLNTILEKECQGCGMDRDLVVQAFDEIRDILKSKEWLASPNVYMRKRTEERGDTEEYRCPDDLITSVLNNLLLQIRRRMKQKK